MDDLERRRSDVEYFVNTTRRLIDVTHNDKLSDVIADVTERHRIVTTSLKVSVSRRQTSDSHDEWP